MPRENHAYEVSRRFGYLRNVEIDLLVKTISQLSNKAPVIVNIGAGTGTSSLAMRYAAPDATIYTIDISSGGPLGGLQNEVNIFTEFKQKLPNQILGDSKEIGRGWAHGKVDVVMIDGDHTETGCSGDIESWESHLVDGGYMIFHDYGSPNWCKVKESADRLMPKLGYEFIELAHSLAVYRKPASVAKKRSKRVERK